MPELDFQTSDPLDAILSLLRPQAVFSKIVNGAGAWSIRYLRYGAPGFCVILQGSCFLKSQQVGVLDLKQGDFVLFPEMPAFTLTSDLDLSPTLVEPTTGSEVLHGTASEPVNLRLLGGYFHFQEANSPLLVRLLPQVIHIRREEPGAERLRRLVEWIAEETGTHRPGRDRVLERLVEVLLVEALRFRPAIETRQEQGLLAGLSDPGLARALREIHVDVTRRWTIADLARIAGMSRAVFAQRFAGKIGIPPMQYLVEWRMAMAKEILRQERPGLAEVAERIGYQSASAFSTAFSRLTGTSPSQFARAPLTEPPG